MGTLHNAIRRAVNQFGFKVLTEIRIINVLSDFAAFSTLPATKTILKYMVEMGIKIDKGKRVIAVEKADEFTALHLGIGVEEPVIISYADVMDDKGRVVSYAITKSNAYTTKYGLVVDYTP